MPSLGRDRSDGMVLCLVCSEKCFLAHFWTCWARLVPQKLSKGPEYRTF